MLRAMGMISKWHIDFFSNRREKVTVIQWIMNCFNLIVKPTVNIKAINHRVNVSCNQQTLTIIERLLNRKMIFPWDFSSFFFQIKRKKQWKILPRTNAFKRKFSLNIIWTMNIIVSAFDVTKRQCFLLLSNVFLFPSFFFYQMTFSAYRHIQFDQNHFNYGFNDEHHPTYYSIALFFSWNSHLNIKA